jgi:hypothetical protein
MSVKPAMPSGRSRRWRKTFPDSRLSTRSNSARRVGACYEQINQYRGLADTPWLSRTSRHRHCSGWSMASRLFSRLSSEQKSTLLLVCACLPLIAVGTTAMKQPDSATPVAIASISTAEMVEIRDSRNVAVLSGEFRVRRDSLGNREFDAALRDKTGRTVIGEVELEIPASGRENRRPELEVDIISLPPRQPFTVVIDDRVVGSFVTDDRGSIDMELQEGELPSIFR